MKTKFIAASALAGLCLVASQASATVVTVTLTGTVDSQFFLPTYGINPFASINRGDAYKAVYTFDTASAPGESSDPTYSAAFGGSQNALGTFGHVDVTVGDLAYSLDGTLYGRVQSFGTSMGQSVEDGTAWYGPDYSFVAVQNTEYGSFPTDFTAPGSYDLAYSFGQIDVETQSSGQWVTGGLLDISLQHVTIADGTQTGGGGTTSAPEPATLSLLLAGLMGAPFFRRRGGKQHAMACA